MMTDYISRQAAIDAINKAFKRVFTWDGTSPLGEKVLKDVPSADVQPSTPGQLIGGVLERNIDNIRQAGLEGKEFRFRIGGRLFAVRELPQ